MIEEVYRRIAAHRDNPVFIHVVPQEDALAQARAAQGPLAGVPFAVKDNIDVAGLPTTAGCKEFSYLAKQTAPCVQKLLDAGAVLVGKTNLDQFATGLVGTRSPYGACRNAFDPAYISGGSSSGSALAVAQGMASFALGTDTAGSGRIPAAFNNIVGLKPTRGLVSTEGVVPACRSLDCVSIFAKTCAEALRILQLMQGSAEQPVSFGNPVRFAVPRQLEFHGDRAYADLFAKALSRFGNVPEIDFAPFLEVQKLLYGPWVAERLADLERWLPAMLPVTRQVIEAGRRYSAAELFKAMHDLEALKVKCHGDWDVLIVPAAPTIYRIAEVEADPIELNARLGRYTNFVNLLDLAAISVPAGFRPDGLPFGVTLIGPAHSDAALAALAAKFNDEPDIEIPSSIRLAVVGAHLSGLPLNHQLTERGARLVRKARTAPTYRLYALEGKPGLVRADAGGSIELEVWELGPREFGSFVAQIPPPLGIGTVELEDGAQVKGFLCEPHAVRGRPDITAFGGWRAYVENR